MTKKKKIVLGIIGIIIIVIVLKLLIGVVTGVPMSASEYTKAALSKNFSYEFNSGMVPSLDSTPLSVTPSEPLITANVLVYVYYAYLDYKAGHISKKQFLEVMHNTKPSIDFLTGIFNIAYGDVIKNDTIKMEEGQLCYVQTNSDGSLSWNNVNYIKVSKKMMDLVNQMYQSQDPEEIWGYLGQYAAYLEQSTFLFHDNDMTGMDQFNAQDWQASWLLGNTHFNLSSVQKMVTSHRRGKYPSNPTYGVE